MTENQIKSSAKDASLTAVFHTILAAENKTSELFVKSFQYQGENITTKHLGQIFGFFEIPDTQEDNAYIVNFLASVVKKEYFINPKRSATDSFEAALHKINLALTELVKQGNTGWLGKLNGVVSVIENNHFHFSVTGDASILLYRDSQVSPISEGLADKDAALHPLKTFLEISSGALLPNDKILITSPELFTLCQPETLRKNAFRMDKNGFARFVRAALVNELPLGVSTIIDLEPAPAPTRPKKKSGLLREESREKLQNVFSNAPFLERETEESVKKEEGPNISEEELFPSEYTDQKTGHIYVQGEAHYGVYKEPSAAAAFIEETLRPAWGSMLLILKRFTKKSRKTVAKQAALIGHEGKELSRTLWQLSKEKSAKAATRGNRAIKEKLQTLQARRENKQATLEKIEVEERTFESNQAMVLPPPDITEEEPFSVALGVPDELEENPSPLGRRKQALERFSPYYQPLEKNTSGDTPSFSLSFLSETVHSLLSSLGKAGKYFRSASRKQKSLFALLAVGGIALAVALPLKNSSPAEPLPESNTPSESVSQSEALPTPALPQLSNANQLASWEEGNGILVVSTPESTVVVTPKSVILNNKAFPFVANGSIESAAYMPDLRMIFLWSSANELVSWNIVDQKFTANIFPLPTNVDASALGTYLTYLYALDKNSGTIYRFARTEGGFGEPTSWLKAPLPKGSAQAFVVNDTIRIAAATTDQYLKGAKEKTLSETSYQVLGSSSEKTFTLGIETASGKLTIWNAEGSSVYEGTHEELKDISAVTYNETSKKLLVTKNQNLVEYSLSW